jgi:hypothetical protein
MMMTMIMKQAHAEFNVHGDSGWYASLSDCRLIEQDSALACASRAAKHACLSSVDLPPAT